MDLDLRRQGDGYVLTVREPIVVSAFAEIWQRIQAERPPAGFRFGVIDLRTQDFSQLARWELNPDTLERMHPVARMLNATLQPGFRLALVSAEPRLDAVVSDLLALGEITAGFAGDADVDLRRFATIDAATEWCRAGTTNASGTTVRE